MPKGLFYCQYLVGIGHLMRSLRISKSLLKQFDIDFLQGGHDLDFTLNDSHFNLIHLPPLGLEDPSTHLDQHEMESLQTTFQQRKEKIHTLNFPYDFLITEIFPFRRWPQFKNEVETLIKQVKKHNPNCLITCALRDSFSQPNKEKDKAIFDFVRQYYDYIFVHADPRVFKLEESFSYVDEIASKIIYTGFISDARNLKPQPRKKQIVVSNGTGSFGAELLYAVAAIVSHFPEYTFVFIKGPKAPSDLAEKIKQIAVDSGAKNFKIESFLDNFPHFLSECTLSISLGGCNTIMDIASTKTPALVLPMMFQEQYIRALKFEGFGFLHLLSPEDLEPQSLNKAIRKALRKVWSPLEIDLSGAEKTTESIKNILLKHSGHM